MSEPNTRQLYRMPEREFESIASALQAEGYRLLRTSLTPCQALKSRHKTIIYAPPSIWSRMCRRQGSWYHQSDRVGQCMITSDHPLPPACDRD